MATNKTVSQKVARSLHRNGQVISRTETQSEKDFRRTNHPVETMNKMFYSQDYLGSISLLTSWGGDVQESYSYDAFGNNYH